MDAVSDPTTHTVVVCSSAQVGKTEVINNVVGFYIDQDPAPVLVLQPTLQMGETWSKDRLAPMLRDTPALSGTVKDPRSRDSGNTLLHKVFPGGHITIAGANSSASLASRPVRILLADEVDRYPVSAGTEGDPVNLGKKRTTTFWNRKIILVSTPTVKGQSRIDTAYEASDQRRYHVPCGDCGHFQVLKWSQVRWPEGQPSGAEYACEECGTLWTDVQRWAAVRKGKWVAERDFHGTAGFHLSEICSPWVKLSDMVEGFLSAKGNPEMLKAWVNTSLGETWEDRGETADAGGLRGLRENYGPDDLPDGVNYATAGVDTQDDRLEVEIVGWGEDEESYGIGYHVIDGDPAQGHVWAALDKLLLASFTTESGRTIRVKSAAIDSGGHHADAVLKFCRERFRRKVYAIKGQGGAGRPIWPARSSRTKTRDAVFVVGVDTAKDAIHARWKIEDEGPGYCHLPADPATGYDDEWYRQATAEQRMTRYREGKAYTVWVCPKGVRNEAFDCRVYAMAANKALPVNARRGTVEVKPAEPVGITPGEWITPRKDWI